LPLDVREKLPPELWEQHPKTYQKFDEDKQED
jgi:hypothetical protein